MNFDRAEWTGTGAAVAFHVALIAAMSISLASVASAPEPPAMEVELVDEVGLASASPEPFAPPPASTAPEIGEAEPAPAPALAPPPPSPKLIPTPQVDAAERRAAQIAARRAAQAKSAPRVSRLGDDFLQGIEADAPDSSPARPAARFDARAQASVAKLIEEQIRPCALQQRELGPGANRIRVTLNLRLSKAGRLIRPPQILEDRTTGVDEDNAQYVDLVVNQAIASYRQCSPLRLPAELYQTPQGGWANINMRYKVP